MSGNMHFSPNLMRFVPCDATVRKCQFDIHMSERDFLKADPEAFAAFFKRTQPKIFAAAAKELGNPKAVKKNEHNVDAAERKMKSLIVALADNNQREAGALGAELNGIPTANQFTFLKNGTPDRFRTAAKNCVAAIKQASGAETLNLDSSDNNRSGSDLEELNTGTSFELKFGAATDLNVGMSALDDALPVDINTLLPSTADRARWRTQYTNGQQDQQAKDLDRKMNAVVAGLAPHLGKDLTTTGQERMNAYYQGITSASEIATASERNIVRLALNKDLSWDISSRANLTEGKKWVLAEAVYSDKRRLSLKFRRGAAEIVLRYHFKNTYTIKDGPQKGPRVDAKVGLGSPSWNGWVKDNTDV